MRIAVLTASDTSGLEPLLQTRDRSELYELACVVDVAEKNAATAPPLIRRVKPPRNLRDREAYDSELATSLWALGVDYVFGAGYPYVLTKPMLDAFPNHIIVLQEGDLTDRDEFGRRRWVGPHAVFNAIITGAKATRTSLYVATRDIGEGPLFLVGERHAVAPLVADALACGDYETIERYARLHRQWMRRSWGTLLHRAVEILAAGSLRIIGDTVWIDGVPGPCRLGEAPDACEQSPGRIRRSVPESCPFIRQ